MNMVAYSFGENMEEIEQPFKKSKYTLTRPKMLNSSLEIKDLESADSATYFCATSAAHWYTSTSEQHNNFILAETIWYDLSYVNLVCPLTLHQS